MLIVNKTNSKFENIFRCLLVNAERCLSPYWRSRPNPALAQHRHGAGDLHGDGDHLHGDDDDDDDDDDVDDKGQNEEQSVLWESGCILKVLWQYLYYWPRYRGYRGGGGKHFDDVDEDDEDNDDVDHEGQNEGESVLWESERILKVLCQYL